MGNRILIATAVADAAFLGTGLLILVFCLLAQRNMTNDPTSGQEAIRNILYEHMPLQAGLAAASFILITFVLTLPGLLMPSARGWLKAASWAVTFCALFSMCLGVYLWIMTLKIGSDFETVYEDFEPDVQSLVQTSFECCGYMNSTSPAFVTDEVCVSPAAAALLRGCKTAVANFGNVDLDDVFTAAFGVVGVHTLFILTIACLYKDRKEREWYRRIKHMPSNW